MLVKCSCDKTLNVPDQFAGKKVRCPACKGTLLAQPIAPVEPEQPAEPEEAFAPAGRTESFAREESANHFTGEAPGAATSWAPSPAEPEEEEEDVEEWRDRKAAPPRRSFFQRFAVLLGLGTGLLILGAMYLVYTLVSAEPAPRPAAVQQTKQVNRPPAPPPIPEKPLTEQEKKAAADLKLITQAYTEIEEKTKQSPRNLEQLRQAMDKQAVAGIDFSQYVIRYDLIKVPAPAAARSMPVVVAYERKTSKEGGMIGFKNGRSYPMNPEQFKRMAQAMGLDVPGLPRAGPVIRPGGPGRPGFPQDQAPPPKGVPDKGN